MIPQQRSYLCAFRHQRVYENVTHYIDWIPGATFSRPGQHSQGRKQSSQNREQAEHAYYENVIRRFKHTIQQGKIV